MFEIFKAISSGEGQKEDETDPSIVRRLEIEEIQSQAVTSSKDVHGSSCHTSFSSSYTSECSSKNARSPPDTIPREVSDKKEEGADPSSVRRLEIGEIQSPSVTSSEDAHRSSCHSSFASTYTSERSIPDTIPRKVSARYRRKNVSADILPSPNKKNMQNKSMKRLNSMHMIINTAEDMLHHFDNKCEMLKKERYTAVKNRAKEMHQLSVLEEEVSFNNMTNFFKEKLGTPNPEQSDIRTKIKDLDTSIAQLDKDLAVTIAEGDNVQMIYDEAIAVLLRPDEETACIRAVEDAMNCFDIYALGDIIS